ncbi:MAG: hypothetical protein AB7E05_09025 [Sphingobium sp.]
MAMARPGQEQEQGRAGLKGKPGAVTCALLLALALTACDPGTRRAAGGEGGGAGNAADQLDDAANALEAKANAMVETATQATENAMGGMDNSVETAKDAADDAAPREGR